MEVFGWIFLGFVWGAAGMQWNSERIRQRNEERWRKWPDVTKFPPPPEPPPWLDPGYRMRGW